jgi:CheY-like chemotaxis protein
MPTKVLYIEDAKEHADAIAAILEFQLPDVEVQTARDGIEGIEKARQWDPDLILLDLMMPRADGIEVIHQLRRDAKIGDVPIVVVSAWVESGLHFEKMAENAGADAVYAKPLEVEQLINIVARYARRQQSEE